MKKCLVPFIIWLALGAIGPSSWDFATGRLAAQGGPNPPGPRPEINPPTITGESRSELFTPGTNITLEVNAEGEGRLVYQWFFNGAILRNERNRELNIPDFGPGDVGTYFAVVGNAGGFTRSNNMNISLRREGSTGVGFAWGAQFNPVRAGFHRPNAVVSDPDGNVYVVGEAPNESGNADFLIVKYNRNGAEEWSRFVDPSEGSDDEAIAVAIHPTGNIIVAGTANRRNGGNGLPQVIVLSLSPSNELNWLEQLSSEEFRASEAGELALAPNGDILVTGTGLANSADIITGRFNGNGRQLWVASFDGGEGNRDTGASIATDSAGNALVVGTSRLEVSGDDIIGIFYNPRGTEIWQRRHSGDDDEDDQGAKALFDSRNRAVIVGAIHSKSTALDFFAARHSPSGNEQFTQTETSRGRINDIPVDAAIDSSNAILITGNSFRKKPGTEGMLVKFDAQSNIEWARSIPATGEPGDQINDLVLPGDNGPVIAGGKMNPPFGVDLYSAKFNSSGEPGGFDTRTNLIEGVPVFDTATAITIDPRGDIILAGITSPGGSITSPGTDTFLVTIKLQVTPPRRNNLPSIQIVSPIAGQRFEFDQTVDIFVTANDQDGPVEQVEILVGNERIGTFTSAPFSTTWVVDTTDPVMITARVTDSDGAVITAATPIEISVTDIRPEIIAFPSDQSVAPGATLNLVAEVTGRTPLRFRWTQNKQPIRDADGPTLTIENFDSRNAGQYELTVQNVAGIDKSGSITVELDVPSVTAGDNFADRLSLGGESGRVKASTIGATREPGEPVHANKRGSSSVWFSFVPEAPGLVDISTLGANFDTLLAVYTGTGFDNLVSVDSDEDGGGFLTSSVRFRATGGEEYIIVVDGFNQQQGTAILTWNLDRTVTIEPPRFTINPNEVVARRGSQSTFTASFRGPRPPGVELQWIFNGEPIEGATSNQLVVNDIQPRDAGKYWVRARVANIEVNSERATLALAARRAVNALVVPEVKIENKFADIFFSFAGPNAQGLQQQRRRPIPLAASLATGFSGAQIFNTFGAVKEIGEPDHCDVPGGASQWFAYQPPIDGTVFMSTDGSDFDTVMAVYTTASSDFSSLEEVACDNDSGLDGFDSALSFEATANTIYYVAVDGVEAATGVVELSYAMDLPLELVLDAGGGLSFDTGDSSNTVSQFIYTITAPQNVDFVIEASADMINWTTVITTQVGEDGTYQFREDEFDLGTGERYFRVYYP